MTLNLSEIQHVFNSQLYLFNILFTHHVKKKLFWLFLFYRYVYPILNAQDKSLIQNIS